jgi:hypothetical protein
LNKEQEEIMFNLIDNVLSSKEGDNSSDEMEADREDPKVDVLASTTQNLASHFEEEDENQLEIMSLFARILSLKKELEGGLKWHQKALSLIHELLEKLCMKKGEVGSTLSDQKYRSLHG